MPSSLVFAPAFARSGSPHAHDPSSATAGPSAARMSTPHRELLVVRSAEAAADKVPRRLGLGR